MDARINVLLADDHQVIRQGLAVLLRAEPDINVVGEAGDGAAAVRLARELRPDVVIMDCRMPSMNGVDATREITSCGGKTQVVALSASGDAVTACAMLRAGARGFVAKEQAADALVTAVRAAASGDAYLDPAVTEAVIHGGGASATTVLSCITPRQRDVLQLIAEGKSTKEAAFHMKVSVKTVETHRRALMEILHVDSVADLTKVAVREGLTSLEQ